MMQDLMHTTEIKYEMPASVAQSYIFRQSMHTPTAWNVAVRFRLRGPLEAAHLETAINRIVDQHEILRTCFAMSGNQVEQRIVESCFVPLAYFDVSVSTIDPEQEIDAISKLEARRTFDLGSLPLLRTGLIKTAPDDHILLLTAHHAVCDGWSVGILAADIMRAYTEVCTGTPFKRDEAALQYADYAVAQTDYASTPEYRAHSEFWNREAARLTTNPPAPVTNTADASNDAEIHSRILPLELTKGIEHLAQNEDLTFFEAVLSAFALTRMKAAQQSQTVFATPVSGRNSAETEAMVGTFVNYLPVHLATNLTKPLQAFRRVVAEAIYELQSHAEYRSEELIAKNPEAMAPAFDHIFICQRDFVPTVEGGGVELTAIPSVSPGALHAMTFFLVERADGWRVSCEINRSVYASSDADAAIDTFEQMLRAFVDQPDATVGSILDLASGSNSTPHSPATTTVELPASEAQQRYWMIQQVQSEEGNLHLRIRLRLHGDFNPETARRALQFLVDRHETLRTTLYTDGDTLHQRIHPVGAAPDFEVKDVRGYELRAAAVTAAEMLHLEDTWNFSAEQHSWLRAMVLILNHEETLLAITLPHSLGDGWSCGILLREFYAAYESLSHGEEPQFQPLELQYGDVALHEQEWLKSDAMQSRVNWWSSNLPAKIAPIVIPADRQHAAPSENGIATFTLDPMLVSAVRQFAQDNGTTLFSVYGSALLGLLMRYTHQQSLSLVSPFANRNSETESIVGPFATPVLIHINAPADVSFDTLLNMFQHQSMEAFENSIPLEKCVELTSLQSRLGRHAANQISFFYQNAFVSNSKAKKFIATPMPSTSSGATFEWQFAVVDYGTDLRIEFQYDTDLWSAASIQLCIEHYQRLLSEMIFHPEKPLANIEIATEEEHARVHSSQPLLPISRCALGLDVPAALRDPIEIRPAARTAPCNDLERALTAIWQQVFHTDAIGTNDDFFDLGGHSLILARIQAQLKRVTGYRIVAADIFAAPTIAQLAERLKSADDRPRQSRVFALQSAGTQPPIFLISQSMVFRRMVQWLHPDQPVYTVLMQEEDIRTKSRSTFEDLAAHYVSIIRSARPHGPYRIGGWCVSSWLAYEIAQQLRSAGEKVDMLLLVDGWAPGYWRRLGPVRRYAAKANYYYARAVRHARMLSNASGTERFAFLREKWRLLRTATSRKIATIFYTVGLEVEVRVEEQLSFVDQIVYAASRRYSPVPYNFPALVFRSDEQPHGSYLPTDLGWSELLQRQVDPISLPGDHQKIFDDPGAQILAQSISSFLKLPPADPSEVRASNPLQSMQQAGKLQTKQASCALANI